MENESSYGIHVQIGFHDLDAIPLPYLTDCLEALSYAMYQSEAQDLADFLAENPQIPRVVRDAAIYRIQGLKRHGFLVQGVGKGSVYVWGAVAGLCFWVLQQTIGETLKESWLESEAHARLKDFLGRRRLQKVQNLIETATKRIRRKVPCTVKPGGYLFEDGHPTMVKLNVHLEASDAIPPPLDHFDHIA